METEQPLQTTSRPSAALPHLPVIRTPEQRVRVFVSSTLDELAPERAAAREAITQLRLTPVLFESGARPYPPRELYRAYLAQSDIFIGFYWQHYGWVAPGMQVSGLEDEYQLSGDRPKLIYMKTPRRCRWRRREGCWNSWHNCWTRAWCKLSRAGVESRASRCWRRSGSMPPSNSRQVVRRLPC